MKKARFLEALTAIASVGLFSCVSEDVFELSQLVDVESVTMSAHNFLVESGSTRTSIAVSDENGAEFAWSANDVVGVFPNIDDASQVRFPISDGNVSGGTATSEANFTGNGWAVMRAQNYMAYYPFISDMELDKTSINVDYRGQKQQGNSSTAHLNKYDHMVAAKTEPSSNGNIGFDFQHMGHLLELNLVIPKTGEYTTLTLHCNEVPFVVAGDIDLTEDSPSIHAGEYDNDFIVNLEEFIITTPGEKVKIYAMIPPVDMSGQTIDVHLQGPNADFKTSYKRGDNKPYKPGTCSRPACGELKGGDIIMLENGYAFNEAIKTLVNGEYISADQTDYLIKSILFETENDNVPSGTMNEDYIQVETADAPLPIYAIWEKSTGTLTLRTSANKIYANEDASYMFKGMHGITSILMDNFDVSKSTSIRGMFENCYNLSEIDLSGFDVASVQDAGELFAGCEHLVNANTSVLKFTDNLTNVNGMFMMCRSLKSIDVSSFNTANVSDFSCMFQNCQSLSTLTVSSLNTGHATSMREMFSGCESLSSIDLSNFLTESVNAFGGMFEGCRSFTKLDISNFDMDNACGLDRMFRFCENLESLILPEISAPNVEDTREMFWECRKLTAIDMNKISLPNLTYAGWMFAECSSLKHLDVSNLITNKTVEIEYILYHCSSLTELDITSWDTSNVTDFGCAFRDLSGLSTLDVSKLNTSSARGMGWMFSGCTNLEYLDLKNFDTSNVISFEGMFGSCSSLANINISSFNMSKATSLCGMFGGCTNLKSVTFPVAVDTHLVEDISGMFSECSSIESLDLSMLNTSRVSNMSNMFCYCSSLKNLNLSGFNNQHVSNSTTMFFDCSSLEVLNLGSGIRVKNDDNEDTGIVSCALCDLFYWDIERTITCTREIMTAFEQERSNNWSEYPQHNSWIDATTGEPMMPDE